MKKLFTVFAVASIMASNVFAWSWKEALEEGYSRTSHSFRIYTSSSDFNVICSTRRLDVIDLYVVGGSTTATATFEVFADSAAFTTTGGLYPGTTYWNFESSDQDTIGEAITYWNAVATTTVGVEGGIVMALRQGAYDGNLSSSMTVRSAVSVHTSANNTVFATDAIIGMSYLISATSGERTVITGATIRATFASGDTEVTIYDGDSISDIMLWKEKLTTSNVSYPLNIGASERAYIKGTLGTIVRVNVVNTSGVVLTAGEINITGFTE